MDRRTSIKYTAGISAMISLGMMPHRTSNPLGTRNIYSSGEKLPMVGLGTWLTFDVGESDAQRAPLKAVLIALMEMGGCVVDSSPMYGRSEQVVGDLSRQLGISKKIFAATKVWTHGKSAGETQMSQSIERMAKSPMDLMQVHNMLDWKTQLPQLLKWKESGKIRYVGITHYLKSAYSQMEGIMRNYPLDFVQFNYSIQSRDAEERLLPFALDQGIAVITNRPFEGGSLFPQIQGKELPPWASEFDCFNWAQFFLKFILSHSAVTCAIPGTSKEIHLRENLGAGLGRLPDPHQRARMVQYFLNL